MHGVLGNSFHVESQLICTPLELSTFLAAALRDWIDFGVIWGLLILNALVGFGQEYHAGNIVNDLKKTLALKAVVVRNGQRQEISAEDLVPGDVIEVEDVGFWG